MEFWGWQSLVCSVLLYFTATASLSFSRPLCSDHDKSVLLQFKHSFQIDCAASEYNPSPYPITKSWIDGPNADCCLWEGVGCNRESGTVIKLDLSSGCLYGSFPKNSSLFRLVHLQNLNLAYNDFNYSQIPSEVGQLQNLQSLNLSASAFDGQIPSEISKLSEISVLDLSCLDDDNTVGNNHGLKLLNPTLDFLLRNLTHLSHLSLYNVHISSILPTFLTNFTSLQYINLALTGVYGEVPANFFRLPHLETVLFSRNGGLTGVFPQFQVNSRLTEIDLWRTSFYGELPHSIGNLAYLKRLRLGFCQFSGSIPSSIGNLTSLTYLMLDNNKFTGDIPLSITNLTSLRTLSLSDPNTMSPQLLLQFSKLHRLTSLRLLGIHLNSEMLSCLANFTELYRLDLGMTGLKGEFPRWIANLTQLQELSLYENLLEGPIPQWFSQLTSLNTLLLGENNMSGNFDMFFGLQNLVALGLPGIRLTFTSGSKKNSPMFKLAYLDLSSCNLTEVPPFLQNQTELQALYINSNNIKGVIPQWLINTTKESLLIADFSSNMLTGFEQPVSVLPWTNLKALSISDNEWQGALPTPTSSLQSYTAANNVLTGNIPKDICIARSLGSLDLSNNSISGRVPSCLAEQLGESLQLLNLRGNNLSGSMPLKFTDLCTLKMINFGENKLMGDLPRSLSNCTLLEILDGGKNSFSGNFPSWLGRLPQLQVLVLRHNKFQGSIEDPKEGYEFPSLRIVDLSNNLFTGHLSSVYLQNWHKMQVSDEDNSDSSTSVINFDIDVGSDKIIDPVQVDYSMTIINKGSETLYTKILTVFRVIDFSSNKFTGKIPDVIGDLVGLQALNLSNNDLVGEIPPTLANMIDLQSLDLSMNMLSGEIPQGLPRLQSLEVFNVSYNHLRGPIPQGEQFNTFDNSSYKGNTELCGTPLSKNCNKGYAIPSSLPSVESDKTNGDSKLIDWIVRSFGCLSGFIIGYVIGKLYITDKYHEWFTEKFQSRPKKRVARKSRHRR